MILAAQNSGWVNDAIRSFFAMLDSAIYSAITVVYRVILYLSDFQLFSNQVLYTFSQRVYSLLGLIMLFKVTFSFITYIVNPDAFLDKQKGVSKVIQNILISLVMLIAAPFAFSLLRDFQSAIIDDQIIPKFFLSQKGSNVDTIMEENKFYISPVCTKVNDPNLEEDEENENEDKTYQMATAASTEDLITIMMFRPFFQPYDPYKVGISHDILIPDFYCRSYTSATLDMYLVPSNYHAEYSLGDSSFLDEAIKDKVDESENVYMIDYKVFLSTIVGIVGLLVLVSFCFDVAIRVIKLGFLQIIAPIPIISYIDPNSAKNGMFKKWLQQVGSTWLSVFIRLAALFFCLFVIQIIAAENFGAEFEEDKAWVILLLILGALMFAKQLPSLINELMPGLKLDGKFTLNPFKRIENEALGGKAILGAAKGAGALALGATGAAAGHLWYLNQNRKKIAEKQDKIAENKLESARQRQIYQNAAKYQQAFQKQADYYKRKAAISSGDDKAKYLSMQNSFQSKADAAKAKYDKAYAARSAALDDLKTNREALKKLQDNRLYKHKVISTLGTTAKGAYFGARDGNKAKGLLGTAKAGVGAIEKASKERNDREKRSVRTDIEDKVTDVFGIKNESGTTSLANKEIKKLNDSLTRYTAEQQRLSQQMAVLGQAYANNQAEYNRIVSLSDEGKYAAFGREMGQAFAEYARQGGTLGQNDFNNIYSNVVSLANVEDNIADIKRQIKEQESIKKKV